MCNNLYIHQSCQQEVKINIIMAVLCYQCGCTESLSTLWLPLLQGQRMLNLPAVTNMGFFSLQAL